MYNDFFNAITPSTPTATRDNTAGSRTDGMSFIFHHHSEEFLFSVTIGTQHTICTAVQSTSAPSAGSTIGVTCFPNHLQTIFKQAANPSLESGAVISHASCGMHCVTTIPHLQWRIQWIYCVEVHNQCYKRSLTYRASCQRNYRPVGDTAGLRARKAKKGKEQTCSVPTALAKLCVVGQATRSATVASVHSTRLPRSSTNGPQSHAASQVFAAALLTPRQPHGSMTMYDVSILKAPIAHRTHAEKITALHARTTGLSSFRDKSRLSVTTNGTNA